jgi:O-succinylhomoserine sulfhydrylase
MPQQGAEGIVMKKPFDLASVRPATRMVHGGTLRSEFGETSEALFLTQGHVYATAEEAEARFKGEVPGFLYARFSNPTVSMFEERMALLEGAEAAKATATGMAAVNAVLFGQLSAGDHMVACKALFGSNRYIIETLLPRFGVTSTLVDGADLAQWEAAVKPNTKVFFLESPTNPTLEVYDIAAICAIAKKNGIRTVVDNVFATPLLQSPLELGADAVVYSTTKHIDGQGRCLGGVILGSKQFIQDNVYQYLRQTGPAMSPFNAWVVLKGLETLSVRVERQTANAAKVADALAALEGVTKVLYPGRADHPHYEIAKKQMRGGSTLIAFEVEGGKQGAFRVSNALQIVKISNNLGDAKSLITHPATTTHDRFSPAEKAEMGITDGLLRLSVGLEDADDLVDDLTQAVHSLAWPKEAKYVRI